MRKLQQLNEKFSLNKIFTFDNKDGNNSNHQYVIEVEHDKNLFIQIQDGGRGNSKSVNGVVIEDLLEIARDMLINWQSSNYECDENKQCLVHIETALQFLKERAEKRELDGIRNKNERGN